MRRLTLILSDLYLPADAVRESFPIALELPALEGLLRFASPRRVGEWRSCLAHELGASVFADWPVAHVAALAAALPTTGTWMATPVALEARLDHVRLRDRGLLHLPLAQQQALQVEFAKLFGVAMTLQASGRPSLMLCGGPVSAIATRDPARFLDSDIGVALPSGSAAASELRRLGTEIEMWLHSSPVNVARERAGLPRIATLWLWGGGVARPPPSPNAFARLPFRIHGTDDYIASLQGLMGSEIPKPMPPGFVAPDDEVPTYVQVAPMSGSSAESLPELERNWFAPIRDALSAGKLDTFRLIANDHLFEVRARSSWKFWRRRRTWLESLA